MPHAHGDTKKDGRESFAQSIVEGWKFISGPLREAVAQGMAGKLEGWSVEPGEPRGAGLGGAIEVAVDGFLTSALAP